jgi:uncharacterized protein (TIGR03437 family)
LAFFFFVSPVLVQAATLSLSANSETVTLPSGATRSVAVTVSVSGASSVGVSIAASTQSGGNWLSVDRGSLTAGATGAAFNFIVSAAALNSGSYVGTVTVHCVSGAACNPATLSIIAIVPGLAALQPTATLMSFSTPSVLQGLTTVFSTDGSSLAFTTTVTQGNNWLQVTQSATVTPSILTITATPGSLATGTYNGTIQLTAANGTTPVPIEVTFTVQAGGGGTGGTGLNISVSPPALEIWTVQQKKTITFPQVRATGTGSAGLSVTSLTSDGNHWLSAALSAQTITGGGNPVNVTVTGDPSAVPPPSSLPASFTGTVTISASPGNSVTIAVTFTLYPGVDVTLAPDPLQFTLVPGQKLAEPVTITFASPPSQITYDSPVNVPPASWLSATVTGNTITVYVDASTLTPDTYLSSIKISGNTDSPFVGIVHVTATVTGPTPVSADQQSLSFPLSAGAAAAQETMNVTAASPSSFTAAVTSGGNWLQVSSNAPATPAALAVIATPGSLPPGTYTGNVRITPVSSAAIDIPVTMVLTATAALSIDTTPIALTAQVGGVCAARSVSILSSAPAIALPYSAQAAVQSPQGGTWLTIGTPGGNTPGGISVSCNSAGLATGNYSGSVSIASAFATNTPVTIPVTLSIAAGTAIAASPTSVSLTLTTGGACSVQQVAVSSTAPASGIAWSATGTVTAGSNWITLAPASGSTPGALTISCNASGLKAGTYSGSVTIAAGAASTTVAVTLAVADLTVTSAASGDPRLAAGMIASLFGAGLSSSTVSVSPPNTAAGGITITVRDSAGASRSATLFYVSPTQINFAIPDATVPGAVTIAVNGSSGAVASAALQVFTVAPGIFTMTGLPAGPAAALATFYDLNNQPLGPADAFRCTPAGVCTTYPLDVNGGPQLVVSLYGTGFHHASNFNVLIGSTNVTVLGVAPSPQFVGEDQMNILIPKSLAGAGDVVLLITADGIASNGPHLNFK